MYFRYVRFLLWCSYVHFHSLYCPLCTIITIICLIMWMWINVSRHMITIRLSRSIGYVSHLSWLFTIIECFQHASIWASLWEYEVVLEYAVLSSNLSTIDWANYFGSIILKVLHKSGLGVVHDILRRLLLLLLIWIIESRCSGVWSGAETTLIHLVLFIHKDYTVILLVTWIACFKASIHCTSNWASAIWELTSRLFVRLVESVSSTISSWFTSSTYSCMITTCGIAIRTTSSLSKCTDVHSCVHCIYISEVSWTTLDWSLSIMINIDSGIHVLIISITIYWHAILMLLVNRIASTSIGSLLS